MECRSPLLLGGLDDASADQVRASDRTHRLLRSLIYTGELGPGDLLPPERELAVQLGISRTALREALKYLEAEGYVFTRVGAKGGTRIADVAALSCCFERWATTQVDRLGELVELQHILETAIASLAAVRREPADLDAFAAAQIPPNPSRSELLRCHNRFHDALGQCAHNISMQKITREIRGQLFFPIDYLMDKSHVAEFREVHDRIFEAIKDRDPDRAVLEMDKHLVDPKGWHRLQTDDHSASEVGQ